MVQPIPSALLTRAASSYLKPTVNKPDAPATAGRSASPLLDRTNGPAFVIELSSAAKQHVLGGRAEATRDNSQKPTGKRTDEIADDDIEVDKLQGASFDITIGDDGRGRREAPLSQRDGFVEFKPAGSIIDVRV